MIQRVQKEKRTYIGKGCDIKAGKMSKLGGGAPGGWRNKKIKQESDENREPQKQRYYHVMLDVSSEVDGDEEEDREERGEKRKDHVFLMLTAIADSGTSDRYCREVGKCDRSAADKTLRWLRLIDQLLKSLQMTVAWLTAKEPLLASIRQWERS